MPQESYFFRVSLNRLFTDAAVFKTYTVLFSKQESSLERMEKSCEAIARPILSEVSDPVRDQVTVSDAILLQWATKVVETVDCIEC